MCHALWDSEKWGYVSSYLLFLYKIFTHTHTDLALLNLFSGNSVEESVLSKVAIDLSLHWFILRSTEQNSKTFRIQKSCRKIFILRSLSNFSELFQIPFTGLELILGKTKQLLKNHVLLSVAVDISWTRRFNSLQVWCHLQLSLLFSESWTNSLWFFLGRCSLLSRTGKKMWISGRAYLPAPHAAQECKMGTVYYHTNTRISAWDIGLSACSSGDCGLTTLSLVSLTANETTVFLSLWLTQNLEQLSTLMCKPLKEAKSGENCVFSSEKMSFPDQTDVFWLSLLLLKRARLSHSSAPRCIWVWGVGALAWMYRLLWTCKLLLLVTHPLISLWVIFRSLCFLSSLRDTEICCSAAS